DYRRETFHRRQATIRLAAPPRRLIPHAVGTSEILWAICPRSRILMFNELTADPRFSVIAAEVKGRCRLFNSRQSELVIAARPDLVLTVAFSSAAFITRLRQAGIPTFDLGSPDSLPSITREIKVLGRLLGEEGNAEALLETMAAEQARLRAALPAGDKPLRLLYYDLGGYIPGRASNFTSLCRLIGAVNVGAEQGVVSWKQVDHETLLRWDPDLIIVPHESGLAASLARDPLLRHARAVRSGRLLTIPGLYLRINSQFILLSANLLAGIVYHHGH
ncbi:MAG: ABC transporter substrate-binding protein, partial [Deltaproteobacteria bacterium]|nr:ABC transporter substrate-binding protein [Deltaproteobacteria bacterium]